MHKIRHNMTIEQHMNFIQDKHETTNLQLNKNFNSLTILGKNIL